MLYRQITFAERYTLGLLRQRGLSAAAIARVLGRHRSTIGREVGRNGTPRDGCYRPQLADWYARGRRSHSRRNRARSDGTYRPQLADWYARGRRSQSRRHQRFTAAEWARIQALLREDWSPEQVAGWLRRQGELAISHETIYRYIWADKRAGGSRASARSARGLRRSRRAPRWGIGKPTRG